MRIAVVEPTSAAGLVHFAYQLCEAMAVSGADVTFYTNQHYELADWPHNFAIRPVLRLWPSVERGSEGRPIDRWSRAHRLSRRCGRAAILGRELVRLMALLLRTRPDIVQFGSFPSIIPPIFLRALRARGIRVSQVCHEFEERDAGAGWRRLRRRLLLGRLYQQVDQVFFLSQAVRESFLRAVSYERACTHVIPHGNEEIFRRCARPDPDLARRYGLGSDDVVALLFGLIRPSKGLEDLLEAFALLPAALRIKLLIVGYPTKFIDMSALRARLERLEIADRVVIDPRYVQMEDVGALMDLARVVVLPYRSATQSGVLHLAYTFGRPVIASAVGGLGEVVIDGCTGFLVPPGQLAALATALREIARDPERAENMGRAARRIAETESSWTNVAAALLAAYRPTSNPVVPRMPKVTGE